MKKHACANAKLIENQNAVVIMARFFNTPQKTASEIGVPLAGFSDFFISSKMSIYSKEHDFHYFQMLVVVVND